MLRWDLMVVQALALAGVFVLAYRYDGEFLWVACILAGGVLGVNLGHVWQAVRPSPPEEEKPPKRNRWRP